MILVAACAIGWSPFERRRTFLLRAGQFLVTTAVVRLCVTPHGVNRQKVTHAWRRNTRHPSATVGPMLSHLPRPTSLTEGSDDSVPEVPLRQARQGSRRIRGYATMPKASRVLAALTPTRWHSEQQQVIVTAPPCIGGRDSKTRIARRKFALASRHHRAWCRLAIRLPAMAGGAWGPRARRLCLATGFRATLCPPPLSVAASACTQGAQP